MPTDLLPSKLVPVTFRETGATENILVHPLSLRKLYVYIKHLAARDTPALVALCADRPPEWVDTITDGSFDALAIAGNELNFQRAADRMSSDPVTAAMLTPIMLELGRLPALVTSGYSTSEPLSKQSPSESAAATGSGSSISLQPGSSASSEPAAAPAPGASAT